MNGLPIVVTGGSRGLGLGMVAALLERGARVATCSRRPSAELEALVEEHGADRLHWSAATIGVEAEEDAFMTRVVEWLGGDRLWGLVNNAGVALGGVLATFPNVDTARILETNLLGALRMTRHALRLMLEPAGAGRIVSISSIVGSNGATGLAAYAASKAGLEGMTRSLAREVGRRGITVNAVAPGYVPTEMSSGFDDVQRERIIRRTPLGRFGEVGDVVPLVLYLLGPDAAFLTGQTITVDGGLTA